MPDSFDQHFDYVIVGAGSAGCVLANRLSADPAVSVCLIEAGPRDWNPFIHMPAGIARLINNHSINWDYNTQPEPNLQGRRLYWPRGKVLGGSSSINAMCYCRGQRADYDHWEALGNAGWGYDDVLPFFLKAEDNTRGKSSYHAVGGPLGVSDLKYTNPLSSVFVEAATGLGYPGSDDFNDERQEGIGFYQVSQRNGRRSSTSVAYLHPVLERLNLTVMTRSRALRVVMEGNRARGVEISGRGRTQIIGASSEVILCGGSINSPQLLMLSGIGPARHLAEHHIDVVHDLPGVGENLQDHLDICTLNRSTQAITYDRPNEVMVGLKYWLFGEGIGTSNIAEAGGFIRTRLAEDARPDMQLHFVPALLDDHGRNRMDGHGFTIHTCFLRPKSRGNIRLASSDAQTKPLIYANYLAEPHDLDVLVEGVKIARDIIASSAFDEYRGEEIFPGQQATSRKDLVEFIRQKAETIYHPVGTCKMGPAEDEFAVVNSDLQVHGIDGLRVVDASIMPELISGNTNAPTIMIAEKIATRITGQRHQQKAA